MNPKIENAFMQCANTMAQCVRYNWSNDFKVEELEQAYYRLQKIIKEEHPDFFNMTTKELQEYGFIKFSATSSLMLIPLYLMSCFENGAELICIDGTKKIVGENYIDDDTRFGCIAYGVYPNDA